MAEEAIRIDAVTIGDNLALVDQSSVDMAITMELAGSTTTTLIPTTTAGAMAIVAEGSLIILMGEVPDGMAMATALRYRISIVGCLLVVWAEVAGLPRDEGMHVFRFNTFSVF